jgi:hypothetical protein
MDHIRTSFSSSSSSFSHFVRFLGFWVLDLGAGVGFLPSRLLEEDRATMSCKQNVIYVQKKMKKMMMMMKKKCKLRGKNQTMNKGLIFIDGLAGCTQVCFGVGKAADCDGLTIFVPI